MILSNRDKPVTLEEKICFGMGDFAINGIFTFVSSYLMFFYTDYAKISLGLVSTILVCGRMIDAIYSVIVGVRMDKSRNVLGKCRPLLLKSLIPLGVLLSALFFVSATLSNVGKCVYACILYMILHNQVTVYYAKCYLKNEVVGSILLTMTPFACIIVAFILPFVVEKIGMKYSVMLGNGMVALSLIGTIFANDHVVAVIVMAIFMSLGWGFATGMLYVIVAQIIEYTRSKDGVNLHGIMTSVVNFFMKTGVAVAGFLGPWILQLGGYKANEVLTKNALMAIKANYIYIPLVLSLLQVIVMSFFTLKK